MSASLAWRDHAYARDICAIELQGGDLRFQSGVAFNDVDGNGFVNPGEIVQAPGQGLLYSDIDNSQTITTGDTVVDDVFAGTLAGSTNVREAGVSFRAGADIQGGAWILGPRVLFTYADARMDGYVETGTSTIATTVVTNQGTAVPRTLGGPIGLELAYDEQSWRSLLWHGGGHLGHAP